MPERALLYCSRMIKKCPTVYSYLLEYYIENDEFDRIMELLQLDGINLPSEKTLNIIPDTIDIACISQFIEKSIKRTAQEKRQLKMRSALLEVESCRIDSERIGAENKCIHLDMESRCSHCGRTINPAGAIARVFKLKF